MTVGSQLLILLFKYQTSRTYLNFQNSNHPPLSVIRDTPSRNSAPLVLVHAKLLFTISNFKSPTYVIRDTPSWNSICSTSISTTTPPNRWSACTLFPNHTQNNSPPTLFYLSHSRVGRQLSVLLLRRITISMEGI